MSDVVTGYFKVEGGPELHAVGVSSSNTLDMAHVSPNPRHFKRAWQGEMVARHINVDVHRQTVPKSVEFAETLPRRDCRILPSFDLHDLRSSTEIYMGNRSEEGNVLC